MIIPDNSVVLFEGDSITDCGQIADPNRLGGGYPLFVSSYITARYPEKNIKFYNRGISGSRAKDLNERFGESMALKPDYLSILIGINDTWRAFDRNDYTSPESYEGSFKAALKQAKETNPNMVIIIMEPFVLPALPDRLNWRDDLDAKIAVARKLALEFGAVYIPLDEIFNEMHLEPQVLAQDGVHPTAIGHMLIAQKWLEQVGAEL